MGNCLNCSILPHTLTPIHSCSQELSATCLKEIQQTGLHVLLLPMVPGLVQRTGCPDQPQLPGHNPDKGAPHPGGVLHPSTPHDHCSLRPLGAPGGVVSLAGSVNHFLPSLPLRSQNNGGIILLQVPRTQNGHGACCPC